ncbi:hypothetical protein J437_LFUL002908 [Ladona fulva]|uniref:Uncharacterized protein n=1 Tax=Ladona fulva TaxID=123851 RepID=A0A8K0KRD2_LADFU|nr:hypothetical protein J437_LFUL002908 [Ladona fulva]
MNISKMAFNRRCSILAAVLFLFGVEVVDSKKPPELLKTRRIPEIGVKRFEPLYIPEVRISQGRSGDPIRLQGSFRNILAHGPSNSTTRFTRIVFGEKNHTITFGIDIPRIRIEADYILEGNIIVLPLVGEGRANVNLREVSTSVWMIVEPLKVQTEDGEREVFRIRDIKLDFAVEGMRIHLGNLFNGNKLLGLTVNNFLNQNSKEVIGGIRGAIGRSLAEVFKRIMNEGFSHMPTDLWLI